MQQVTPEDMQQLQTSNYNVLRRWPGRRCCSTSMRAAWTQMERNTWTCLKNWNLINDPKEQGPVVFVWWDSLMTTTYADEFAQSKLPLVWPDESSLLDGMKHDSAFMFADDITTPSRENDSDCINKAFSKAVITLKGIEKSNHLEWTSYKSSAIRHLLRIPALSRMDLYSGGGENIINAHKKFTGPSWRMVVEMTAGINALWRLPEGKAGTRAVNTTTILSMTGWQENIISYYSCHKRQ